MLNAITVLQSAQNNSYHPKYRRGIVLQGRCEKLQILAYPNILTVIYSIQD